MERKQFSEGELMAYLHGETNSELKQALADSSELRQELALLEETFRAMAAQFGELDRPDTQDLIDVALEQASPTQKLRVAAYVRNSERGRREMAEIEQDITGESQSKRPLWRLPLFLAAPLATSGVRSGEQEENGGMFQVVDIQLQITVRIIPPIDGRWALEGYLTQNFLPMAEIAVALHDGPGTLQTAETDEIGFFRMTNLAAGSYQLGIHLEQGIVQIQEVQLVAI